MVNLSFSCSPSLVRYPFLASTRTHLSGLLNQRGGINFICAIQASLEKNDLSTSRFERQTQFSKVAGWELSIQELSLAEAATTKLGQLSRWVSVMFQLVQGRQELVTLPLVSFTRLTLGILVFNTQRSGFRSA